MCDWVVGQEINTSIIVKQKHKEIHLDVTYQTKA